MFTLREKIIWAWQNIPRTPRNGGGASVWLYLFWRQRLTSVGRIFWSVVLLITLMAAFPGMWVLRPVAMVSWSILVVGYFWTFRKAPLHASWQMPDFVEEGQLFLVTYNIHNTSLKKNLRVSVEWIWEELWVLAPQDMVDIIVLAPGQRQSISISLKAHKRGPCQFFGPVVYAVDPWGIWRSRVRHHSPHLLGIYPSITQSRQTLDGQESKFYQGQQEWLGTLRNFRKGDSLRLIAHSTWARTGKPLVREMGNTQPTCTLVIDTGCATFFSRMHLEKFFSTTLTLAQRLEKQNALHKIILNHEELLPFADSLTLALRNRYALLERPLWWSWPKCQSLPSSTHPQEERIILQVNA